MKLAERKLFGTLANGEPVEEIRLACADGIEVRIITLGAAIQSLLVPDAHGQTADIVTGHDEPQPYRDNRQFFGGTIGRFSNRIANGRFPFDGKTIQLLTNAGPNTLHGGPEGFDQRLWTIVELGHDPEPFVRLSLTSPDGDQGFPGEVEASVTYRLTGALELSITHEATTDAPTVIGMTHHSYFNLGGVETPVAIKDHRLMLTAEHYLPLDETLIPRGAPVPVAATLFDFRQGKRIGKDLDWADAQLQIAGGYDHCFCLSDTASASPRLVARLEEPASGRVMELLTDQPGLQFYSGNMLSGTTPGKFGQIYRPGDALCLEPQAWPDAPNRPDFPSARLNPGERYKHHSIYRFSTM